MNYTQFTKNIVKKCQNIVNSTQQQYKQKQIHLVPHFLRKTTKRNQLNLNQQHLKRDRKLYQTLLSSSSSSLSSSLSFVTISLAIKAKKLGSNKLVKRPRATLKPKNCNVSATKYKNNISISHK